MSDTDKQQLNGAEWKGYVTRALEDIGTDVKNVEKKVDSLIPKVAAIGAVVGLLVSLAVNFFAK